MTNTMKHTKMGRWAAMLMAAWIGWSLTACTSAPNAGDGGAATTADATPDATSGAEIKASDKSTATAAALATADAPGSAVGSATGTTAVEAGGTGLPATDPDAQATSAAALQRAATTATAVGAKVATTSAFSSSAFRNAIGESQTEVARLASQAGALPLDEARAAVQAALADVEGRLDAAADAEGGAAVRQLKEAVQAYDKASAAAATAFRGAVGDADRQAIGGFIAEIEIARSKVANSMFIPLGSP